MDSYCFNGKDEFNVKNNWINFELLQFFYIKIYILDRKYLKFNLDKLNIYFLFRFN